MDFDFAIRARIALILLLTLGFLSELYLLANNHIFNASSDDPTLYQKRFEILRPMLPRRGLVGYFSDKGDPFVDSASAMKPYYLTQYTLSPLIVANSQKLPLVIGNFDHTNSKPPQPKDGGLVLKVDFRNGLQLFSHPEAGTLGDSKRQSDLSK